MNRTVAAALIASALACHLYRPAPQPTPFEGEWARVRDKHARSAKLYDGFTTRAFGQVLYAAPEVRRARVDRLAAWRGATPEEKERMAATEREEGERWEEFLVSFFTADRGDNDLGARQSIWRVALVVPGEGEALPANVDELRADATFRELYPEIGDFDTVYRVRFPRWRSPLVERPFSLEIAGARGRLAFRWPGP
jgi:hypothetical protein